MRVVLLAQLLCLILATSIPSITSLKNKEVTQDVRVSSQIATYIIDVKVYNEKQEKSTTYEILLPEHKYGNLSFFEVTDSDDSVLATEADLKIVEGESNTVRSVSVPLEILPSKTSKISIKIIYVHVVENYPKEIGQKEKQLSRYFGNHYFYSPYKTESVTTKVSLPGTVIKHSVVNPTSSEKNTVTYGPYTNIGSNSLSQSSIHFVNEVPLITVNRLVREVEVSHWGNVAIEDYMFVTNDGPELSSGFSRLDYQLTQSPPKSVLKDIEFALPKSASNVYYRDHIGNISTSFLWDDVLVIEPRFPLFGGWKTKFCMGYDLPLNNHVEVHKANSNLYTLTVPLGPRINQDIVIDEFVIRIILPEGVSDIEVIFPLKFDNQQFETRRTYLDIQGRSVVVLEKKYLENKQVQLPIKITYKFSSSLMWRKPFMLIAGFYLLFLLYILASRINLTLTPKLKSE